MGPNPAVVARYVESGQRFLEMHKLAQLMRHWFATGYPETYVSVDTETTGFSLERDIILEVGWTIVRNRVPVTTGHVLINWFESPHIDPCWLIDRMAWTRAKMNEKGQQYPYDAMMLQREGARPQECMELLVGVLNDAAKTCAVGNNLWGFDTPRLDKLRHQCHDGLAFEWNADSLIDIGIFEKAAQQDRMPWPGNTRAEWYKRAASPPFTGAKWSLDYIIKKYRLDQRYGLDAMQLHRSGYDSYAVACALETFRDIGDGVYQDLPLHG